MLRLFTEAGLRDMPIGEAMAMTGHRTVATFQGYLNRPGFELTPRSWTSLRGVGAGAALTHAGIEWLQYATIQRQRWQ
ncbi:hypothetical protein [Variovorax sp. LG9.2]|uniref:hypothetical protein n=1 Tax=Variovorax sp. LG9.2 TaxID=3048626 RepID=UPI002B23CBA4|nr:hypothetical protein [Variovorax sp. LG9.2]MEB0060129.1 hypothetical protein [Variovorax sp. LG9.2]